MADIFAFTKDWAAPDKLADVFGANNVPIQRELPGSATADTITKPGVYPVLNESVGTSLGLPASLGGLLFVRPWGLRVMQSYRTRQGTWERWSGSTGWHPWRRADALDMPVPAPNSGTTSLTTSDSIDALKTLGSYSVLNGTTATSLGLPAAYGGVLEVSPWGSYATQVYRTVVGTFQRWSGANGWAGWSRTDTGGVTSTITDLTSRVETIENTPPPEVVDPPKSGFKTLPVSLTLGQGTGDGPLEATVRLPLKINAPVTRWRLRIANRNPRYGASRNNAVNFSNLFVSNSVGDGTTTDTPTNAVVIPAIPAGASETVTRWVSHVSIGANRDALLSFGYSTTAAPFANIGGGWTTTKMSDAGLQAPADLVKKTGLPFQVWLEVETYSFTPALAGFGDSLTCGAGANLPVHESWLSQYCRTVGAIPVHYAASGDTMRSWLDSPDHVKWTQWAHLDKADAVMWSMGSNDIFALNPTVDEMKARHTAIAPIVKDRIAPVVYASTIMPRTSSTFDAQEPVRRAYNTWLTTLPNGVRDVFDFGATISADDDTIKPEFNADGIHLTTSGYAANAAAITRPVTSLTIPVGGTATAAQDTGWVSVAPSGQGTGGKLWLRRVGDEVRLRMEAMTIAAGSYAGYIAVLPAWAKPAGAEFWHVSGAASGAEITAWQRVGIYSSGMDMVGWIQTAAGSSTRPTTTMSGSHRYNTATAFPTSV